jgi:3-oxoacyl-[acyl-carrier-protein] synthase II
MSAAAVTGVGVVSPFGVGIDRFWQGVLGGQAVMQTRECGLYPGTLHAVASAPTLEELSAVLPGSGFSRPSRTTVLARVATAEAWQSAKLTGAVEPERLGLLANRNFGQQEVTAEYLRVLWSRGPGAVSGLQFVDSISNSLLGRVALEFGVKGPCTLNFGTTPLFLALDLIRDGSADAIIVLGVDELSDYVFDLCSRCGLLGSEGGAPSAGPYDASRRGILPGEGTACIVLESVDHARGRNVPILGFLRGGASISDPAAHSDPAERGSTAVTEVIRRALDDSRTRPEAVEMVSGAATGLESFDEAELVGIAECLRGAVPVQSVKGAVGECWGAAAGLAVIAALLSMKHGVIPPTARTTKVDGRWDGQVVRGSPMMTRGTTALAMSFEMSGQNTAFVLGREEN